MSIFVDSACGLCSARQCVHDIKDLLMKQRACVFYLYEQGLSLLVDILFLFPYSQYSMWISCFILFCLKTTAALFHSLFCNFIKVCRVFTLNYFFLSFPTLNCYSSCCGYILSRCTQKWVKLKVMHFLYNAVQRNNSSLLQELYGTHKRNL